MHVDTHHSYPSHTHLVAVMMFSAAGRSLPTGTSKSSGTVVMLNTLRPTPSDVPATVSLTPLPIDTMAEPGVGVNVGMATIFGDTTTAGGEVAVLGGRSDTTGGVVTAALSPSCMAPSRPMMAASATTMSCNIVDTSLFREPT